MDSLSKEEFVSFPGFSQYYEEKCCCCSRIEVNGIRNFFLGHWEFSLQMPIIVFTLILFTFVYNVVIVNRFLSFTAQIIIDVIFTLITIIYIISYLMIIIEGPGYFPFYYAGVKDNSISDLPITANGANYSPHGIISNSEQYLYATTHKKPDRCIVARSSRRIVIRPDHLCTWTSSWIGKRNMKMFIQFNGYGTLYSLISLALCIYDVIRITSKEIQIAQLVFSSLVGVMSAFFLFWQLQVFIVNVYNMIKGRTTWEIWNYIDENKFNKGKKKNIEDVFGEKTSLCGYLCPTAPFKNLTEEDLIVNYKNYYY